MHKIRTTVAAAAMIGAMQAWALDAVGGMGANGATSVVEVVTWPAALAPAWREFAAKCEAGMATRGDLIALKKFIAASAVDGAAKTNLTRQARTVYQKSKKKESGSRK